MNGVVQDIRGTTLTVGAVVAINPEHTGDVDTDGHVVSVYPDSNKVQVFVPKLGHHIDVDGAQVRATGDMHTPEPLAAGDPPATVAAADVAKTAAAGEVEVAKTAAAGEAVAAKGSETVQ